MNPVRGTTEWFVLEFRANKIAFHVAYTALIEYTLFSEKLLPKQATTKQDQVHEKEVFVFKKKARKR